MSTLENGILLALVALLPLIVLTLTSFVKLSVVLSLVRNALGTPDAPSGLVVTGLSLVLTFFVMAPVAVRMMQAAALPTVPAPTPSKGAGPAPVPTAPVPTAPATPGPGAAPVPQSAVAVPMQSAAGTGQAAAATPTNAAASATAATPGVDVSVALRALVPAQYEPQLAAAERAMGPLREFLIKHTRSADRETFSALAGQLGSSVRGDELWVIAPAFIATELREAFAIAILIFIPFLVIDLVVALGLASLGLQGTNPATIALPLKLVLFVAVDGWRLLLDGLLRGYV